MRIRRAALLLASTLAGTVLTGCVSLQAYAQLTADIPAERFVTVEGRKVYVEDRGTGDPVVLLHGFGASSYSWRQVAEQLSSDFRIIAIDLPGFGFTERPASKNDYTGYAQSELVLGVVDALGLDKVHLVGHSYGGALSMALAVRHPERLRSLTLVNAAAPDYPKTRRSAAAAYRPLVSLFVRTWGLRPARVERGLKASTADDSLVTQDLIDEYWRRLAVEGSPRAYWGLTAPAKDPQEPFATGDIEVPTLVVWGSDDVLIPVEGARRHANAIRDSRFVVLDGVGHLPMEERPQALAEVMRVFLTGEGQNAHFVAAGSAPDRAGV